MRNQPPPFEDCVHFAQEGRPGDGHLLGDADVQHACLFWAGNPLTVVIRFREDLIYRLNVIGIHLPPLRERREDIPLLVPALLEKITGDLERGPLGVAEEAMALLQAHDWPGNVRELENVLTQAAVHSRNGVLTPDLLSIDRGAVRSPELPPVPADTEEEVLRTLEQVEAEHIQRVLDYSGGHKGRSSQILGISRPALDRKIKKYGLTVPGR